MSRNERIRDRYPAFYVYGDKHTFLGNEEAVTATLERRIQSIWPFIVRRVLAFSATLKPRERVNFDPEDVLTEVWLRLADKDDQWTPERGKYITFAGVIIERELCAIRDKARTVQAPRNSSCRMKEYREEEAAGVISERRAKTANDIRRTSEGTFDLLPAQSHGGDKTGVTAMADDRIEGPVETLESREAFRQSLEAIRSSFPKLTAFEANVLSRLYGLGEGRLPESVWWIAFTTQRDETEVRRAKDRAVAKIRKHLAARDHPVTND